jgi:hypothetical protein
MMEFLGNLGFKVESPDFLNRKSGASHIFDLTTVSSGKKQSITAIYLTTSTESDVPEHLAVSMFAEIFDGTPGKAYLMAIQKMNESGRKLAALYKVNLIEAEDQDSALEALKACMTK